MIIATRAVAPEVEKMPWDLPSFLSVRRISFSVRANPSKIAFFGFSGK